MDYSNIQNNNNEFIDKKQYNFCISLISQLIEETEFETNINSNKDNRDRKILLTIFSLLKFQIKLFKELFVVQDKKLYNIVQFQQIKSIFENGKKYIKKNLKQILSHSICILQDRSSKNTINNITNSTNNSQNMITDNKNTPKSKCYNTKTFNKKLNNYLIKNDERKVNNKNAMETISKNNDFSNNSSSIPSYHLFKQNKPKKTLCNIKKNNTMKYKNKNGKLRTKKKKNAEKKNKNYNTSKKIKNYEDNNNNESNIKTEFNMISSQKISVNQINKIYFNKNEKTTDINKERNYQIANSILNNRLIEENPVRKVKNIIINARSLSSLNIVLNNKYVYNNKRSNNKLKISSSVGSFSKYLNNNTNKSQNDYGYGVERKTYTAPFYTMGQKETQDLDEKIYLKKAFSKDRKSSEILIDGMRNIKMKLNSLEKNKKFKKANSIGDLSYIKTLMKNKQAYI